MRVLWLHVTAFALSFLVAVGAGAGEIHDLVRRGEVTQIRAFIGAHPELVNARDDRDCTPLHFSVNRGEVELVRFLVDKGADFAARDADGDTPLHWAAIYGKPEIADLLISRSADVNVTNGNSETVLQYALRGRAGSSPTGCSMQERP